MLQSAPATPSFKLPTRSSELQRFLDRHAGIPLLKLLSLFRRRRPLPANPRRIGIVQPIAIGDMILNSGVLLVLKRLYPSCEIHVFHSQMNAGAVAMLPLPLVSHVCDFKNILDTVAKIRSAKLDAFVDLTTWPRLTALYARLSGAVSVGFDSPGQHRGAAFDVRVPHSPDLHETQNLRAIAQAFGACPDYPVGLCKDFPQPDMLLPYDRLVLCHVMPGGTRGVERAWPADYWAELTRRLTGAGYIVAFTGTAREADITAEVLGRTAVSEALAFSLCGKLNLDELGYVLSNSRLLITVDTGVLHLGSVLNIPLIGLHGPSRSARWGARSSRSVSLDSPHQRGGYANFGFETRPWAAEIMPLLTVDMVHDAALQLLSRYP